MTQTGTDHISDQSPRYDSDPMAEPAAPSQPAAAVIIPETVSPEGLRQRACLARDRMNDSGSCARHIELAADEIETLRAETERLSAALAEAIADKRFAEAEHDDLDAKRLAAEARAERMREALEPFADIGQWLFARAEIPDDTPMVVVEGLNGSQGALTRGHFKQAHAALKPDEARGDEGDRT